MKIPNSAFLSASIIFSLISHVQTIATTRVTLPWSKQANSNDPSTSKESSSMIPECRFTHQNHSFDFCSLMATRNLLEVASNVPDSESESAGGSSTRTDSFTRRVYTFTSNRALIDKPGCGDAWICLTETRGSDHHDHAPSSRGSRHTSIPIGSTISDIAAPNSTAHSKHATGTGADSDSQSMRGHSITLRIVYYGSFLEGKLQSASIDFACDAQIESGRPVFTGEQAGVHSFIWATRYACPIADKTTNTAELILPQSEGSSLPNSKDERDNDNQEELINPRPMILQPWMWVILVTCVFMITFALSSTHRRFLFVSQVRILAATLKLPKMYEKLLFLLPDPTRFRIGEMQLVRWSEEDMVLNVVEHWETEDDDSSWLGADEYIPLKVKRAKRQRDYGSARRYDKLVLV